MKLLLLGLLLTVGGSAFADGDVSAQPAGQPLGELAEKLNNTGAKNHRVKDIYQYAGEKQCDPAGGKGVHEMEQDLQAEKIVVFQRRAGVDGLAHVLSCGEDTGAINIYVIAKEDLSKALELGFKECAELESQGGGCQSLHLYGF